MNIFCLFNLKKNVHELIMTNMSYINAIFFKKRISDKLRGVLFVSLREKKFRRNSTPTPPQSFLKPF